MRILVVNTGSSSLKLQVLAGDDHVEAERSVADWDGRDASLLVDLVASTAPVDAVGHRVVHGGVDLVEPVLIDDEVVGRLAALAPLAPLHQGRALAGITTARQVLPDVEQVACFDTAYHRTLPAAARTYALPADWRERWPLRRFGFHGLSHAYAARRAAELLGREGDATLRVLTCHLGAGASLCASLGGRSVDTTMGFTPLEGLVMGTRAGSVDPGMLLWLLTDAGMPADALRDGLEHSSGLLGLAGTSDMREVVARMAAGDEPARLAFDVYVHVLCREMGALTASLGGLDAVVFTGGVGENVAEVRAAATSRLAHLGVAPHDDVDAGSGKAPTFVVGAREDLEIARLTRQLLA